MPAPAPAAPLVIPGAPEVVVTSEKTSASGEVLRIGEPRLRLVPGWVGDFVVRVGAKRAFAVDRDEIKIWELEHGRLLERLGFTKEREPFLNAVVSADGRWLAGGSFDPMGVRPAPYTRPQFEVKLARPHRFSRDGTRLLASSGAPVVIDLAQQKAVAGSPRAPIEPYDRSALDVAESDDGSQVWWLRRSGLVRWDRASNEVTVVTKAAQKWVRVQVALRAPVAIVSTGKGLYRLELTSGAISRLSTEWSRFAISPNGQRVLLKRFLKIRGRLVRRLRVIDAKNSTQLGSLDVPGDVDRIAYTEDDDTIAYIENGQIRLAVLDRGKLRVLPVEGTTRFRGWAANSIASLERDGQRLQLDVATRTISASPLPPLAPPPSPLVLDMKPQTLVVRDAKRQVLAELDAGTPPRPGPQLEHEYWQAVGSPSGTHVALWWRRADVQSPPPAEEPGRDVMHTYAGYEIPPTCETDRNIQCKREYFGELWSLAPTPTRVWQFRPAGKRQGSGRSWPLPKVASGPIAFTHDGTRVLFGFDDGDVMIRSIDAAPSERVESLHRAPITRIDLSPDDRWVFTEDAEGEQRIWPLAR
ncbi:MAG: hypothetical protein ACTHU0_30295 [Kofleriaceae bacterium]